MATTKTTFFSIRRMGKTLHGQTQKTVGAHVWIRKDADLDEPNVYLRKPLKKDMAAFTQYSVTILTGKTEAALNARKIA